MTQQPIMDFKEKVMIFTQTEYLFFIQFRW